MKGQSGHIVFLCKTFRWLPLRLRVEVKVIIIAHKISHQVLIFHFILPQFFFFYDLFILQRKGERMPGGGAEGPGKEESQADSLFHMEPNVGPDPTTPRS